MAELCGSMQLGSLIVAGARWHDHAQHFKGFTMHMTGRLDGHCSMSARVRRRFGAHTMCLVAKVNVIGKCSGNVAMQAVVMHAVASEAGRRAVGMQTW